MSKFLLKLKVVLWKNFIIRKRHWVLTIFEILMSVFIFLLLAYMQTLIPSFNSKTFLNETEYHYQEQIQPRPLLALVYTPNGTDVSAFMSKVGERTHTRMLRGFATEEQLLAYIGLMRQNDTYTQMAGIVFEHLSLGGGGGAPTGLKYRLRTDMPALFGSLFPHTDPFFSYAKKRYFDSGFLCVQQAIDLCYIEALASESLSSAITLQEMPYPPHYQFGQLTTSFIIVLPFCTILAFILIFPSVLKRVIEEKSTGIKELMKMVGLEPWMLWLGWFVHSMVTNVVAITFIVAMLKVSLSSDVSPIIAHSRPELLWLFLFLYCTAGICYSFAISTLFRRPTLGMCTGLLLWLAQLFLANPVVSNDDPSALRWLRSLVMLLPNACLSYGYKAINEYEKKEIGLNWGNLYTKPTPYMPHPTVGCVFTMLLLDSVLFMLVTWYIDNVFPGQYGIARPWYFPFTKSYWMSNKVDDECLMRSLPESNCMEAAPTNLDVGIQVRDLYKCFGCKQAVNGLSLDIYNNQITVLLGHNGAGKTTTMHIITGMLSPTSGKVLVNGYNIQTNMSRVRESLGLCPQHNLHFSDLNVLEHLMFFAMLKGARRDVALHESRDFLARLNLAEKANKMASELSGGMRRKLSLGMALVGKSKVLMLDEPTSGMDPEARREIWDFLLGMRGERTILITTHYMEEADVLGDRIAIMHNGQLQCYGTSLFLKKHYGTGYTLAILVGSTWSEEQLTEEIRNFVPSASMKGSSAGCVTYMLPTNDTTAMSQLFARLEATKATLGITNIGISITTLEEVFLKVGEIADERQDKATDTHSDTDSSKYLLTDSYFEDAQKDKITSEYILTWQQFLALFVKRCQYAKHKWIMMIVQMLVPLAMAMFIMGVMTMSKEHVEPDVRRDISLAPYTGAQLFYSYVPKTEELATYLPNIAKKQGASATPVLSVSNSIVSVGEENMSQYQRALIAAIELNHTESGDALNGLYGNWALHGPAIALNFITNMLLQKAMHSDRYTIAVVNNPLPSATGASSMSPMNVAAILMWMFLFPVAFTIMLGFFLIFLQEERQTGAIHLQIMAGVSRALYWLVNYVFDLIVYMLVVVLLVFILALFDAGGPIGNSNALQALCSLCFLYGFAALPFSYLFVYRASAASSMTLMIAVQIVFGTIGTVVVLVLENLPKYKDLYNGIKYTLLLLPNFAFSDGIFRFTVRASEIHTWRTNFDAASIDCETGSEPNPCCASDGPDCAKDMSFFTGTYSLTNSIIFLTVHIFLYSFLLLLLDSGILRKHLERQLVKSKLRGGCVDGASSPLDEDVEEERVRIDRQIKERVASPNIVTSCSNSSDVLEVSNLRKWYGRLYAVRGLNFGVKFGECFGLLGVNGAGKTTTFKMLTGEIFPSTGYADIQGYLLSRHKATYMKQIGYCPQFDALNMTLTGYEMLALFARIRGIPNSKVHMHVERWISKFGIKKYEHLPCRAYSGGNKRKLSTALALIGEPPLIMLDEPTSGVDPVARRNLWDILTVLRKSGQSIVLTSHSMDECEALCDRLAIMVDGQLKCIGNIQYLKKKFGEGFTVMLKLRTSMAGGDSPDGAAPTPLLSLKRSIENKYMCTLKDEHTGMLLYHIRNPEATLADVFDYMEKLKAQQSLVEDYIVSDTSLEQVFLSFAEQKEQPAAPIGRIAIV